MYRVLNTSNRVKAAIAVEIASLKTILNQSTSLYDKEGIVKLDNLQKKIGLDKDIKILTDGVFFTLKTVVEGMIRDLKASYPSNIQLLFLLERFHWYILKSG